MIIECPNCAAGYQVDDRVLERARTLRCARCHHSWTHTPAAPAPHVQNQTFTAPCPSCAAQYRIALATFPAAGRPVRCGKCQHLWHQLPPQASRQKPLSPAQRQELTAALAAFLAAHARDRREPDLQTLTAIAALSEAAGQALHIPAAATGTAPVGGASPFAQDRPSKPRVGRRAIIKRWRDGQAVPFQSFFEGKLVWLLGSAAAAAVLLFGIGASKTHIFDDIHWLHHQNPAVIQGLILRDVNYRRETGIDGRANLIIGGRIENHDTKTLTMPKMIRIRLNGDNHQQLYQTAIAPSVAALAPNQAVAFQTSIYDAPQGTVEMQVTLDQKS
jgi:predicted Zn finger-like uncharacterized protein